MSIHTCGLRRPSFRLAFAALFASAATAPVLHAAPTWTDLYDVSSASSATTQLRSIALSSDDSTAYIGFIQKASSSLCQVRNINASTGAAIGSVSFGGDQPNTIATDDRGNVFMGTSTGSNSIDIYNSALGSTHVTVSSQPATVEGLDVYKSGSAYYLYAAYGNGTVRRYDVTGITAGVGTVTLDTSFGTAGSYTIAGAGQLRGLDVDDNGVVYVAQRDTSGSDRNGKVYELSAGNSPTLLHTASITGAMDEVEYGGKLYVTEYAGSNSVIKVLDPNDLSVVDTLDPKTTFSRGSNEGYAMIDVTADGHLYLNDENYSTTTNPVGDRVLVSSVVPEPTSLTIMGFAGAMLLRRRRHV